MLVRKIPVDYIVPIGPSLKLDLSWLQPFTRFQDFWPLLLPEAKNRSFEDVLSSDEDAVVYREPWA